MLSYKSITGQTVYLLAATLSIGRLIQSCAFITIIIKQIVDKRLFSALQNVQENLEELS